MTWNDGVDRATGYLVTATNWNDLLGASGSLMELKAHTHDGSDGDGNDELSGVDKVTFDEIADPSAPGADKTVVWFDTSTGQPKYRSGAAGAVTVIADDPTSAQGDVIYRNSSGRLARLAPGTAGHFLKTQGAGADPVWAAPSVAHADTTGRTANDHHAQAHGMADHTVAGTADIADVAAAESAGVVASVPRGDHVHAHGSGYLADAHHARAHNLNSAADHTGSLTTAEADLGADVDLAAVNTYYDGPSVSLAVGTWFIVGTVTVAQVGGSGHITAKLWDGSTVEASSQSQRGSAGPVSITLAGIVTLGGVTTMKISAASDAGGDILAAAPNNGAGNNASHIRAVKIGA